MVAVLESVLELQHLPAQCHHHHGLGEPLSGHLQLRLVSENKVISLLQTIAAVGWM